MRIVLLLGALVLGLGSLPGCSEKPTTAGGQTVVGTAAADSTAKAAGPRIPKGPK
jgi:hypothetical protein